MLDAVRLVFDYRAVLGAIGLWLRFGHGCWHRAAGVLGI